MERSWTGTSEILQSQAHSTGLCVPLFVCVHGASVWLPNELFREQGPGRTGGPKRDISHAIGVSRAWISPLAVLFHHVVLLTAWSISILFPQVGAAASFMQQPRLFFVCRLSDNFDPVSDEEVIVIHSLMCVAPFTVQRPSRLIPGTKLECPSR